MIEFTVLTITLNAEHTIGRVVKNGFDIGASEVIVVPNNITDDTAVAARDAGATVVPFEGDFTFSAVKNTGLDAVRTDYVFLLDSDERIEPIYGGKIREAIEGHLDCGFVVHATFIKTRYFGEVIQPRIFRAGKFRSIGGVYESVYPHDYRVPPDILVENHKDDLSDADAVIDARFKKLGMNICQIILCLNSWGI